MERNIAQGPWNEIWWKVMKSHPSPPPVKLDAIFLRKNGNVVIDRYFLYFWGVFKIVPNPRLSLIVPLNEKQAENALNK